MNTLFQLDAATGGAASPTLRSLAAVLNAVPQSLRIASQQLDALPSFAVHLNVSPVEGVAPLTVHLSMSTDGHLIPGTAQLLVAKGNDPWTVVAQGTDASYTLTVPGDYTFGAKATGFGHDGSKEAGDSRGVHPTGPSAPPQPAGLANLEFFSHASTTGTVIHVPIRNAGSAPSGPFTVYVNIDNETSTTFINPSLTPHQESTVEVVLPAILTGTTHSLVINLDTANVVAESDEQNLRYIVFDVNWDGSVWVHPPA